MPGVAPAHLKSWKRLRDGQSGQAVVEVETNPLGDACTGRMQDPSAPPLRLPCLTVKSNSSAVFETDLDAVAREPALKALFQKKRNLYWDSAAWRSPEGSRRQLAINAYRVVAETERRSFFFVDGHRSQRDIAFPRFNI